ncbi:MAG: tyrosine-type recombinase/integrase [Chloroflexota bacterium]
MRGKPLPFRRKSDGLWVAQVSIGPRGKRRLVRRYSQDKDEAQRLLIELLDRNAVADNRTTVGAYLRSWLEMTGARTLKASTLETYEIAIRRQLIPHVGSIELGRLAPEHVERMIVELGATMSPKGIRNALSVLGRVLDVAERRGLVRRNVVRLVDPPRVVRAERHALTIAHARQILAAVAGDRLEALWVVTLACGLRQAEVLGLRWRDVDLDDGSLRVEVVLDRQAGKYVLTEPKTASSRRTISLPLFVAAALREHRRRQLEERLAAAEPTEDGLVFVSPAGRPLSAGWLTHRWRKLLVADYHRLLDHREQLIAQGANRDDLPMPEPLDLTMHDLRHGQATLLVALGVHPKVVSDRLGHATVAMTMDVYSGVTRASDVAAAALLEEALG